MQRMWDPPGVDRIRAGRAGQLVPHLPPELSAAMAGASPQGVQRQASRVLPGSSRRATRVQSRVPAAAESPDPGGTVEGRKRAGRLRTAGASADRPVGHPPQRYPATTSRPKSSTSAGSTARPKLMTNEVTPSARFFSTRARTSSGVPVSARSGLPSRKPSSANSLVVLRSA